MKRCHGLSESYQGEEKYIRKGKKKVQNSLLLNKRSGLELFNGFCWTEFDVSLGFVRNMEPYYPREHPDTIYDLTPVFSSLVVALEAGAASIADHESEHYTQYSHECRLNCKAMDAFLVYVCDHERL